MISLEKYNISHAENLCNILNNDIYLNNALGREIKIEKSIDTHNFMVNWIKKRNSKTFSIISSGKSVGLISLVDIDIKKNKAKVGYWLSSQCWNRGFTTEAFRKLIHAAQDIGINTLWCTIKNDNEASKRIWLKFNPTIDEYKENWREYQIEIKHLT